MLKVKVEKENKIIKKITFIGHTEYEDYGKDIVCAAASTMLITTVNAIFKIDCDAIKVEENEEKIVTNIKQDEITNKLLENLYELLKELESQYKNNIKIYE